MSMNNNKNKESYTVTAKMIAERLNVSVKTLTNWYLWYRNENMKKPEQCPPLPDYYQDDKFFPRLWTEDGYKQIKIFHDWLPHGKNGVMGEYNRKYWKNYRKKDKVTNK